VTQKFADNQKRQRVSGGPKNSKKIPLSANSLEVVFQNTGRQISF
jgi:hypothetical protein